MRARTESATRRRILRLGGAALAIGLLSPPLVAEPQQPTRVFRIVQLNPAPAPPEGTPLPETQRLFRQILRDLGYVQGQNILIEDRFAAGSKDRLREDAAAAVRLQTDVIVAISSPAVEAAANASTKIPIVALDLESDPVASGFVASLARPGKNVTGVFVDHGELSGKGLQLLNEAIPRLDQVAVLWNPITNPAALRAAEVAARSLGFQLQVVEARVPSDFEGAYRAAVKGRNRALMIIPSPVFGHNRKLIADLAVHHRLATTSTHSGYTEAGLLMSYGPNFPGLVRQVVTYVDRILKGAKPGDLPVERPAQIGLIVNLKTASAIGLTVPPMLILRADRVIE